jgi:hypothetical protein
MLGLLVAHSGGQASVLQETYDDRTDYDGSTATETFEAAMAVVTRQVLKFWTKKVPNG